MKTLAATSAQYRQAAEQLLRLYEASGGLEVDSTRYADALYLHALVAATVENARAALSLIDAGFHWPASAPVRVAFEHALTAQWAYVQPDGLKALESAIESKAILYFEQAAKVIDIPDDLAEEYAESQRPFVAPPLRNFEALCRDFDEAGWLYLTYRAMSAAVHVSPETVRRYVHVSDLGDVTLRVQADAETDHLMFSLALSLSLSIGVYEDLRLSQPKKAELDGICAPLALPTLLEPADLSRRSAAPDA